MACLGDERSDYAGNAEEVSSASCAVWVAQSEAPVQLYGIYIPAVYALILLGWEVESVNATVSTQAPATTGIACGTY